MVDGSLSPNGPGREISVPPLPESYLESVFTLAQTDPAFQSNALAATEALGSDNVSAAVALHARYDIPGYVRDDDGKDQLITHYRLRQFVEALPAYAERAAEAGLDADRATGLVQALLSDQQRNERFTDVVVPLRCLGDALRHQAQANGAMSEGDYAQLHDLIVATADADDHSTLTVDNYRALSRLGMPTAEAVNLIRDDLYGDTYLLAAVQPVTDALAVAEVDTADLASIYRQLVGGEERHIYEITADLRLLRECIIRVSPGQDIPPARLLATIRSQLEQGVSMTDIGEGFLSAKQIAADEAAILRPHARADKHFLRLDGPLELSPLPYRTERPLVDGIRDLGQIAVHDLKLRQPIGEGLWVFDRAAQNPVWYSLGGESQVTPDANAVRHTYPEYPVHELSREPILAHCHPTALEWVIGVREKDVDLPLFGVKAFNSFLAATPSRRDYAMVGELLRPQGAPEAIRSVIAHGSGVTEYTFPQDPDELEAMADASQQLRNEFLAGIRWDRILYRRRWGGLMQGARRPQDAIVAELIERYDQALPAGFGMHLLNFETMAETTGTK